MSKVSVLLVTYNQEKYVCNALDSIEMQNYEDIEVVVADDGSTDQTLSIIENFSQKSRFKYIFLDSSRNLGINENYRRALNACKCDYIEYWRVMIIGQIQIELVFILTF